MHDRALACGPIPLCRPVPVLLDLIWAEEDLVATAAVTTGAVTTGHPTGGSAGPVVSLRLNTAALAQQCPALARLVAELVACYSRAAALTAPATALARLPEPAQDQPLPPPPPPA